MSSCHVLPRDGHALSSVIANPNGEPILSKSSLLCPVDQTPTLLNLPPVDQTPVANPEVMLDVFFQGSVNYYH